VEQNSAAPILDNTERAGLPYNHQSMCTFESKSSPGYTLIIAALIRYSNEASKTIPLRWANAKKMLLSLRMNEAEELMQ
jgi:hypothetical protein